MDPYVDFHIPFACVEQIMSADREHIIEDAISAYNEI